LFLLWWIFFGPKSEQWKIYVYNTIQTKRQLFQHVFQILFYFSQRSYKLYPHQAPIYNPCNRFTETRLQIPFYSSLRYWSCSPAIGLKVTDWARPANIKPSSLPAQLKHVLYSEDKADYREPWSGKDMKRQGRLACVWRQGIELENSRGRRRNANRLHRDGVRLPAAYTLTQTWDKKLNLTSVRFAD
jgi:hypothetical protein